ncbi:hypothetical protein [Nocardia barduliensis]|uniref:hypothetical protein n=1 Tax=Nocardia barduliensis TaxID=2736643 RepID=UPI001572A335|nr:hypothetical protein [Nocardia barduliensis]
MSGKTGKTGKAFDPLFARIARRSMARRADVDIAAQVCQEALLPGVNISQGFDPGRMSLTAALVTPWPHYTEGDPT